MDALTVHCIIGTNPPLNLIRDIIDFLVALPYLVQVKAQPCLQ